MTPEQISAAVSYIYPELDSAFDYWVTESGLHWDNELPEPTEQQMQDALAPAAATAILQKLRDQIQLRLDAMASVDALGYDDIHTMARRKTSHVEKFRLEGEAADWWGDETWRVAGQIQAEVIAGTRPMPTDISDIEADLPACPWDVHGNLL